MVSLIQLEYIVAVANTGQFSSAAEKCFVTQPTLSMQIKKLENDLGIIIFDRSKQPVVPTDIGKHIVEQAKRVLAESDKIEELIQESKQNLKGTLRIGVIPSVSPYLVPLFIGKFVKKYPDIEVSVKEMLTEEIEKDLQKDEIDVGILSTPLNNMGISETPLFYEKILLYCHASHPLVKKKIIKAGDLKEEDTWLLSQGHCFRNQVVNLCTTAQNNGQLPFKYESASIETLIKLVDNEGGLTLIPELTANQMSKSKQKLIKSMAGDPVREISLVTNRVFVKKRILDALSDAIKKAIPKEMLDEKRGEIVEWS